MLRTRPAPPPARRQLFLDDEPVPTPKPPKSARTLALLRAAAQLGAILAVMGCVAAVMLKFAGGPPDTIDPLTASRLPASAAAPGAEQAAAPKRGTTPPKKRDTPASKKRDTAPPERATAAPAAPTAPAAPPAQSPSANELAGRILTRFDKARIGARARLARAKTAAPQSAAARDLATASGQAAGELEQLDAGKFAGLVQALRNTENAYAGLAQAIADGNQRLYDAQRDAVINAEAAVTQERSTLR